LNFKNLLREVFLWAAFGEKKSQGQGQGQTISPRRHGERKRKDTIQKRQQVRKYSYPHFSFYVFDFFAFSFLRDSVVKLLTLIADGHKKGRVAP
jgi:hypothetical protein